VKSYCHHTSLRSSFLCVKV